MCSRVSSPKVQGLCNGPNKCYYLLGGSSIPCGQMLYDQVKLLRSYENKSLTMMSITRDKDRQSPIWRIRGGQRAASPCFFLKAG